MKKKEMLDILNEDIAYLEGMMEDLKTTSAAVEDLNLEELSSVEFLDSLKERSKEFYDQAANDPVKFDNALLAYVEEFEKEAHFFLDGALLWTPHAIEYISNKLKEERQ